MRARAWLAVVTAVGRAASLPVSSAASSVPAPDRAAQVLVVPAASASLPSTWRQDFVVRYGAGKTHLTRAVAEGLGVRNPAAVNSPTFTLIHEYPARLPVYHFDAYRLSGPREFAELGVDEYFRGDGVCLVEWADKVDEKLLGDHVRVEFTLTGESSRRLMVHARGERSAEFVRALNLSP